MFVHVIGVEPCLTVQRADQGSVVVLVGYHPLDTSGHIPGVLPVVEVVVPSRLERQHSQTGMRHFHRLRRSTARPRFLTQRMRSGSSGCQVTIAPIALLGLMPGEPRQPFRDRLFRLKSPAAAQEPLLAARSSPQTVDPLLGMRVLIFGGRRLLSRVYIRIAVTVR